MIKNAENWPWCAISERDRVRRDCLPLCRLGYRGPNGMVISAGIMLFFADTPRGKARHRWRGSRGHAGGYSGNSNVVVSRLGFCKRRLVALLSKAGPAGFKMYCTS